MIAIKELTTLSEMQQVQLLEEKVWNSPPVPTHQTYTAIKHGGIMVGAYDEEQLIGFSYGFAAFKNGKTYLCSHMLGIDDNYRSQQIGERLKFTQRKIAIERGYDLMVWTFDPLETRNGYLNLTKLNGICDTYVENCYGEMQDDFNKGLPSDRFEVHWHLTSNYVTEQQKPLIDNPQALGFIQFDQDGFPDLKIEYFVELNEASYRLPVPKEFQQLKSASQECALRWRLITRTLFQQLFAAGYVAVALQQHEHWNEYIFVKKETLAIGGSKV